MSIFITFLGLIIPFIGTTLGSSLIYLFKNRGIGVNLNKVFNGFAAGVMFAASVFGLIMPALDYKTDYMPTIFVVIIAFILGVLLLLAIDHLIPHIHSQDHYEEGIKTQKLNRKQKMFLAVLIHNIPEGLSVGVIFGVALANLNGSQDVWLALSSAMMLSVGIAIQNLPEGAIVSLPFKDETHSTNKAFLYGVFSGAVEPIFALVGLLLAYFIQPLMPWALALAAGCMIYVTIEDLIPTAVSGEGKNHYGIIAFVFGFLLMMALDVLLGWLWKMSNILL